MSYSSKKQQTWNFYPWAGVTDPWIIVLIDFLVISGMYLSFYLSYPDRAVA